MLKVNNISVGYTKDNSILKEISFSIKRGEVICIMGASGSGKSTLLKALYGLLDLGEGTIFWNEKRITGPKDNLVPGEAQFKYVPQNFELMPYISVSENVAKYLPRTRMEESNQRVQNLLEIIEMSEYADELVKNLSGGQQQRVAIARALSTEPKLLLLDEPFGQIDNCKKNNLRRNLFFSLKEQGIPCVIATHDGDAALSFADKIIVLKDGEILMNENPMELYSHPKDTYVASLLDDVNELTVDGEKYLLYPSQLKITEISDFSAKVMNCYFKGSHWLIECFHNKKRLFINHHQSLESDKEICFKFKRKD